MENNWTMEQTKRLFDYVNRAQREGRGLSMAFMKMSDECGRSLNSVRNYYYSQLKMFSLVPNLAESLGIELIGSKRSEFELFTEDEIKSLIETVLKNKANGISVRSTIAAMTDGNEKKALRLQNKYRSMVTHHKDKVTAIMNEMNEKGEIYFNPYTKKVVTEREEKTSIEKLTDYISGLNENEIDSFFHLIKKLFA